MKRIIMLALLVGVAAVASAGVMFDFTGTVLGTLGAALENQPGPVSFTNSGIVATFTASDGIMNANSGSFGINSSITGDDGAGFDVGEWIDVTFDQAVTLTNVYVTSWSSSNGDEATIYVDGISSGTISSTGNHLFNISVASGDVLRISGTAGVVGNGWSLNGLTVDAVPEPATLAMFGIGGLLTLIIRRSALK
ncbi:MAG: PEP-CTERM sorting domain-containing protein [Verrucomicrobia bacterium]|nr:PEP-CTERM sorting domain-containing protein [Verrucomicrobiota bacterium]